MDRYLESSRHPSSIGQASASLTDFAANSNRIGPAELMADTRSCFADESSRSRGRKCPSFALQVPPSPIRGRGECRVPNAPAAWCAHIGSEYAHQYSQRRHRKHPAFPTQWFYGFLRALPGDHRFVDPVIRATRWRLANLTPASGRQNHTASPSATASARLTLRRVHRIPPRERGDRVSPLWWDRMGEPITLRLPSRQGKFLKTGNGI